MDDGFYIVEKLDGGKARLYNLSDKVFEHREGEVVPEEFCLVIPHWIEDEFFRAFLTFMDREGRKTENDHKLQGKIEAMRDHLQDMKRLIFEPSNFEVKK